MRNDFGQPPGGGWGPPPGAPPPGGGAPPGGGWGPPPGAPPPGAPPQGGQPPGPYGPPPGHAMAHAGYGHPAPYAPSGVPQEYKTAGVLILIAGIMNVISALTWFFVLIWLCVGIFWLLPLAAAIFEIVVGAGVMQGRPNPQAKTASILGIVAAILCANVISLVCEIIALVMLGKPEVDRYLATGR